MGKKGIKAKERKGKKTRKKTKRAKKSEKYQVKGDALSRGKVCSRCGPGIFMAEHKNRWHCGRCGFTEFKS